MPNKIRDLTEQEQAKAERLREHLNRRVAEIAEGLEAARAASGRVIGVDDLWDALTDIEAEAQHGLRLLEELDEITDPPCDD